MFQTDYYINPELTLSKREQVRLKLIEIICRGTPHLSQPASNDDLNARVNRLEKIVLDNPERIAKEVINPNWRKDL